MEYKRIIHNLRSLADQKLLASDRQQKIINTNQKILGVRTGELRDFAKTLANDDLQGNFSILKDNYFEETLLAGFIMGHVKDIDLAYNMLISFIARIDNWATCDQTCSSLKVFKKDKDNRYFQDFLNMATSSSEFTARVGLIMLMCYYLKPECIDQVLELLPIIKNHSYYVDMAASWLISVSIIKFKDQTLKLIKSQTLSKFVQNKAISKCRDSYRIDANLKEELKSYRK